MTVKEVSCISGVSVRTLQHYDNIGLLRPAGRTEAGYRVYDEASLRRLQEILLLRELELPLKDIGEILNSPNYDRGTAIREQIAILECRRRRLDDILSLARKIQDREEISMNFKAFDRTEQDALTREAREKWGGTDAYREYGQKSQGQSQAALDARDRGLMAIFAELGKCKDQPATGKEAQEMVGKLQAYITRHYYTCTKPILATLGQMYVEDARFRENIDAVGGPGTARFTADAIAEYCK